MDQFDELNAREFGGAVDRREREFGDAARDHQRGGAHELKAPVHERRVAVRL